MKDQGPIEQHDWPSNLDARVIGAEPRTLHGYDVETDLARHYRFGEVVLTALSGEAPDEKTGRAFEIAMIFASALPVSEGPTHAAVLARLCGARTSSTIAVAATTLAELARESTERSETAAPTAEDRASTERLRVALGEYARNVPKLYDEPTLETAVRAVFEACGLRTCEGVETALCIARLAATCAEAFATRAGDFRGYPMDLPRFEYEVKS